MQWTEPAGSLAQFADGYWLAPFDGKSDESRSCGPTT